MIYENQIIHGDCACAIKHIPDSIVNLTVFSPPYDDIRDYGKNWKFDYKVLGSDLFRATTDGGVCAVIVGDGTRNFAKSLTSFRLAVDWCDRVGWKLFECCIYSRHGNPGAWWSQRFRVDHEYILIFFKGRRPRVFNKEPLMVDSKHAGKVYSGTDRLTSGGFKNIAMKKVNSKKCRGTLWHYATSNSERNKTKLLHPATFPDRLAQDLIMCFSSTGDIVLDPMCGSGTTCVAAAKHNRRYIGIEIHQPYADLAKQRLSSEYAFS